MLLKSLVHASVRVSSLKWKGATEGVCQIQELDTGPCKSTSLLGRGGVHGGRRRRELDLGDVSVKDVSIEGRGKCL